MSTSDITENSFGVALARQLATVLRLSRNGELSAALAAAYPVEALVVYVDDRLMQAGIFYQLAKMLYEAGAREEVRSRFERSLALLQPLDEHLAGEVGVGCLLRLGTIHLEAGRFSESMDCYQRLIKYFTQVNDLQNLGATWSKLGVVHYHAGDLNAAQESFHRALLLGEQVGDFLLQAKMLGNLGQIAFERYQLAEAEQQLRAAIELFRTLNEPSQLADQVGELGNLLRLRGRTTEVVHCYEEVLSLGETQGSTYIQKFALGSLGAFYWERHELSQALLYLKRSVAIGQEHSTPAEQVTDFVHLARVHQALRQPEQAAHYLRVALALAERAALAPELLHGVFGSLASMALAAENFEQAESYYRRELATLEQLGDVYNVGTSWLNLGLVAWKRDDFKQASIYWHQALELHEAADNRIGIAIAYLNLGNALRAQGDVSTGETHLQTALNIAENLPLPDCARNAWESLGQLRWLEGDATGAYDAYEQAISWAERSRAAVVGQTHRISFWQHLENLYLILIQLNLSLHNHFRAWQTVQRARSRAFSELLGTSRLPVPDQVPLALRQREEELLARLRQLQPSITEPLSADQMAHWLELSAALDALWTEMQPLVPEYVSQRRGEPTTFAEVLAHLVQV